MEKVKHCPKCNTDKTLDNFYMVLKKGIKKPDTYCKACYSIMNIMNYEKRNRAASWHDNVTIKYINFSRLLDGRKTTQTTA